MKFKEGDEIIMIGACSGIMKGDRCVLKIETDAMGYPTLFACRNGHSCSHQEFWKLTAPPTKEEMLTQIKSNLI